jgi:hypothetical protein
MEKVVIIGLGSMGTMIANLALKKGMQIVGAFEIDERRIGKDVAEVLGIGKKIGVPVSNRLETISNINADVALYVTVPKLRDLCPQVLPALKAGMNVISTADELAFPWTFPEAELIDKVAKENRVTFFGTGANPGFLTDVLPAILTSGCEEVNEIKVRRVVDFSPFGPTLMQQLGIGLSREDWEVEKQKGKVAGHLAAPGLVRYIADCMGLKLDEVTDLLEPVIAKNPRLGAHAKVEKGNVAGILHSAHGIKNGKKMIIFEMDATIQPKAENVETGNYWTIKGRPTIEVKVTGTESGQDPGFITAGRVVNSIPVVIKAKPGLLTQKDLPMGACIMRE